MTEAVQTERTCPFSAAAGLRERPPVSRLRFGDGSLGWVVTTHAEARKVLSDNRFSARGEIRRSPVRPDIQPSGPGLFSFMDPPQHTRYRKLLTGGFTVRRMRALEPRVAEITGELLDALEKQQGSAVDLVEEYALPLASRVICELLGVPYGDHEFFERNSREMVDPHAGMERQGAAGQALQGYLHEMVVRKRANPGDDLVSGLCASSDLTDMEITGMATSLLFAGHETVASMLSLGTFALLEHPEQLALLHDNPAAAVEELLRYLSIVQFEVNRAALADVELGGELIEAGETVLISLPVANRDPRQFERPGELDLTRSTTGHLAFGFGVHQCIGQQLARIQMRIGFSELFKRFPTLKLAVAAEDVELNTERGIYSVAGLPVTW